VKGQAAGGKERETGWGENEEEVTDCRCWPTAGSLAAAVKSTQGKEHREKVRCLDSLMSTGALSFLHGGDSIVRDTKHGQNLSKKR